MRDKIYLPAILDKDLLKILEAHDLINKLKAKELKCICCSSELGWDNIGGIKVSGGKIFLLCNSFDCLENIKGNKSE